MTEIPDEQDAHAGHAETPYQLEQIEAEMKSKHSKDVTVLIYLLKSPYQLDREKASDYLGEIGNPEAVPALIEALGDPTIRLARRGVTRENRGPTRSGASYCCARFR